MVSLEIVWGLWSILLISSNYFSPFYEIWMQESCQFISMLSQHTFFFLLNYLDPPQLDQSLLFDLTLLLLLGFTVLLQLDLPQFFNFSLMLLLFHSFFLSCHLIQFFLLCHSFKHSYSKLLLQISLLLLLLLL